MQVPARGDFSALKKKDGETKREDIRGLGEVDTQANQGELTECRCGLGEPSRGSITGCKYLHLSLRELGSTPDTQRRAKCLHLGVLF